MELVLSFFFLHKIVKSLIFNLNNLIYVMIKYVYLDSLYRPVSIKETEETIKNNYIAKINEFHLDLKIIAPSYSGGLFLCPTELYKIYQDFWNNAFCDFEYSKKLRETYNLFKDNITWFNVFRSDSKYIIQNNIRGRVIGLFRWNKFGINWGLQLIKSDI